MTFNCLLTKSIHKQMYQSIAERQNNIMPLYFYEMQKDLHSQKYNSLFYKNENYPSNIHGLIFSNNYMNLNSSSHSIQTSIHESNSQIMSCESHLTQFNKFQSLQIQPEKLSGWGLTKGTMTPNNISTALDINYIKKVLENIP